MGFVAYSNERVMKEQNNSDGEGAGSGEVLLPPIKSKMNAFTFASQNLELQRNVFNCIALLSELHHIAS